jgi:nicotinate-nucleotide adenylyltransferase
MRRIGVYGGTFDPIHIGHLVAAAEAQYVLGLDQVLFLPAGEPPHKVTNGVTAARHRQRMVELAIKDNPAFALSTIDLDRPGPHYTADALSILRETERDAALWFVMGEDTLLDVPNWLYPERIVEHARLAVVTRPGWKVDVADLAMLDARHRPLLRFRAHPHARYCLPRVARAPPRWRPLALSGARGSLGVYRGARPVPQFGVRSSEFGVTWWAL